MEIAQNQIIKEEGIANRKKAFIPNLLRFLGNLVILYFIPNHLSFFRVIILSLCLYSFFWLVLEALFVFNYSQYKILPFIPATSDLLSTFTLIYLTGSGNSLFSCIIICLVTVSTLFSPDTYQPIFILSLSLILYFLLLLGLYFQVYPYINIMNFENNQNLPMYFFAFLLFVIMVIGLFNSVRLIAKANIELNEKLKELIIVSEKEKNRSEKLLLNILPEEVADELKERGFVSPVLYENVSILFTDFKGFTKISEKMSPDELIKTLDSSFTKFDQITEKYNLEKLKTIGDSYMCAGGLPVKNNTNPVDTCLAGLELKIYMNQVKEIRNSIGSEFWEIRIGIHCGSVIAGVIGEKKFAYDIWGDAVNTASRLESSGETGEVNISQSVYEKVKDFFICEYRGKVPAKNKGEVDMYFLKRIHPELSADNKGHTPNEKFFEAYNKLII